MHRHTQTHILDSLTFSNNNTGVVLTFLHLPIHTQTHTDTHTLQLLLPRPWENTRPRCRHSAHRLQWKKCSPLTSLVGILAAVITISFSAVWIALADGQCKESRHYTISWEGPGGELLIYPTDVPTPCVTGLRFKSTEKVYQAGREWRIGRLINICFAERNLLACLFNCWIHFVSDSQSVSGTYFGHYFSVNRRTLS